MKNLGGKRGRVGGMYSIIFNFIDLISFSVLFCWVLPCPLEI